MQCWLLASPYHNVTRHMDCLLFFFLYPPDANNNKNNREPPKPLVRAALYYLSPCPCPVSSKFPRMQPCSFMYLLFRPKEEEKKREREIMLVIIMYSMSLAPDQGRLAQLILLLGDGFGSSLSSSEADASSSWPALESRWLIR
jgi:hypothetical protein